MLYIARMYVKLARLHSSVLLGVAPVCGAIAMGKELSFMHYFILFVIGLFVHIYWFVLNEYADIEVDRKSKDLAGKPLVSGAISPNSALAFLLCALACSFLLLFLFPIKEYHTWHSFFLLQCSQAEYTISMGKGSPSLITFLRSCLLCYA
ncbi:MAG: UbiA family prenyltransferase [Thermoplasmata archaeon]